MYATCRFSLCPEPCRLHAAALMLNASAVAKSRSAWNVSTCSSEPGEPAPGMPSRITAFRSSAAYQPRRSLSFSTTNKPKNTARIVNGSQIVKDVRRCFVRSFAVRRDDVRRGERARPKRSRSESQNCGERRYEAKEDAPSKFTGFTDGPGSLLTIESSRDDDRAAARCLAARPPLRAWKTRARAARSRKTSSATSAIVRWPKRRGGCVFAGRTYRAPASFSRRERAQSAPRQTPHVLPATRVFSSARGSLPVACFTRVPRARKVCSCAASAAAECRPCDARSPRVLCRGRTSRRASTRRGRAPARRPPC